MKNYKFWLLVGIFLLLLIIPFRWFANNAIDACGDDPKMQFYAPGKYIENYSVYTWSSYNALSVYNMPHPNLLFSYLPWIVSKMGFTPAQSQKFFYGLILSCGFLFVFLIIKELILSFSKENKEVYFWPALIGGLFYIFSPLVQYTDWMARLSTSIFTIFLYPALFYYLILAITREKIVYLLPGVLLSAVFAFSIYVPVPWMFSFFIGALIFLASYFIFFRSKRWMIIKMLFIYIFFIFLVNIQSFGVLIDSMFNQSIPMLPTGDIASVVTSQAGAFIINISSNFNALYTFSLLPSKDFVGLSSIFKDFAILKSSLFLFLLPIVIASGFILSDKFQRKFLMIIAIPFVVMLYFITVSITDLGPVVFGWIASHVFGFVMFRNFYGKFPIVFSFFYSILIALSLALILLKIKSQIIKNILIAMLLIIAAFYSWPLATGRIIGVSPSASIHEKLCPEIPRSHLAAVDQLKELKDNQRVSIFPVSFAQYMCFKGSNEQFYVAIPFIKILSSHDELGGIWSYTNLTYPQIPSIVTRLVNDYDIDNYAKILWFFNVGYLYTYNEVAPENAQMFIYKYPFNPRLKEALLSDLSLKEIGDYETVNLYKVNYSKKPDLIQAKSIISKVDRAEWLSKLIYSELTSDKYEPQIIY
jgi:hypothetical protein